MNAHRVISRRGPVMWIKVLVWIHIIQSKLRFGGSLPAKVTTAVTLVQLFLSSVHASGGVQMEYAQYRIGEAEAFVSVAVVRDPETDGTATVQLTTLDETATAGSDYQEVRATVTFAPGESVKLVAIPILNDDIKELGERFQVNLSNPTGGALGTRASALVLIVDNDPGVQFAESQWWVHEDLGELNVTVLRGNDQRLEPFTVDYTMTASTAQQGTDYEGGTGRIQFNVGEMSKSIHVTVFNDQAAESDERFQIRLANTSDGRLLGSRTNATVTIFDATGTKDSRFGSVQRASDGSIRAPIVSSISKRFTNYHGIFQVETSDDLRSWEPAALIGHPFVSETPPSLLLSVTPTGARRFARIAGVPLICPNPAPTGPYAVGRTRRQIDDSTRRNRYGVSTNGSFPVSIWYPAVPVAGRLPDSFVESELEGVSPPDFMDRLPRFSTYSSPDLPLLHSPDSAWPILLFSHSSGGFRLQAESMCLNLASHGFVVVSPDHFDAFAVRLPSGDVYRSSTIPSYTSANAQERVRDLDLILDHMEVMHREDPLLKGGFDLTRAGAFGYALGASTAAEFCRSDSRCKAVVSLDWGVATTSAFPDLVREGLQKPSLMLNAVDNTSDYLFSRAERDVFWVQISNTVPSDFILVAWLRGPVTSAHLEIGQTIQALVTSFFKKYLQGDDDHLLDDAPANFRRVSGFKRK